ncbi:MAG TPA: TIGR00268 family protein, partial [Thermomicrobiales bacterium]|nr:TIGR00268 family protein [Thermomicrobiales bacterium]
FQYGDPITVEKLRQVGKAESGIRALGIRGFRVRHHDDIARLEIPEDLLVWAIEHRAELTAAVLVAGYRYVTLDLEGFRSGSMNEVLSARIKSTGLRRPGPG